MRFAPRRWILPALGLLVAPHAAPAAEIDAELLFRELDANRNGYLSVYEAGEAHARLFHRMVRTSDEDGDGQLKPAEFAAGLTPIRADKPLVAKQTSRLPGSDALVVLIAKLDANADRRIMVAEVPARFREVFAQMLAQADGDKNGLLDARELATAPRLGVTAQLAASRLGMDVAAELAKLPRAQRAALESLGPLPANGDLAMMGNASPRRAAPRQLLKRFDANGDGALQRDEVPTRLTASFSRLDANGSGALEPQELLRAGDGRRPQSPRPQ